MDRMYEVLPLAGQDDDNYYSEPDPCDNTPLHPTARGLPKLPESKTSKHKNPGAAQDYENFLKGPKSTSLSPETHDETNMGQKIMSNADATARRVSVIPDIYDDVTVGQTGDYIDMKE